MWPLDIYGGPEEFVSDRQYITNCALIWFFFNEKVCFSVMLEYKSLVTGGPPVVTFNSTAIGRLDITLVRFHKCKKHLMKNIFQLGIIFFKTKLEWDIKQFMPWHDIFFSSHRTCAIFSEKAFQNWTKHLKPWHIFLLLTEYVSFFRKWLSKNGLSYPPSQANIDTYEDLLKFRMQKVGLILCICIARFLFQWCTLPDTPVYHRIEMSTCTLTVYFTQKKIL